MLHVRKEEPLWLNKYVVVNAYFSKSTFVNGVIAMSFYVESHFRDNAYLSYLTNGKPSSEKIIWWKNRHGTSWKRLFWDYPVGRQIGTDTFDYRIFHSFKNNVLLCIWKNGIRKCENSIPSLIQRRGLEHVGLLQNLFPCRILCPRRKTVYRANRLSK